jgi:hypothetical protein
MLVDQVWRGTRQEIVLALEHEHTSDMAEVLSKEVEHLIDIRAEQKIGIFYPNLGDETDFMDKALSKIRKRMVALPLQREEYMFILGFQTRKDNRRAIRFHARRYGTSSSGLDWKMEKEIVIFQPGKESQA